MRIPRRFLRCDAQRFGPVGMQSYSKFSTPTAGTRVPEDSPDNAIKDRVQIAEAKAAVKTLLKHVNSLDEFAVNTHQKADSAFFDVHGEIANVHGTISGLHTLFEQLNERVTKLESVNEEKGAWCALCGCAAPVSYTHLTLPTKRIV